MWSLLNHSIIVTWSIVLFRCVVSTVHCSRCWAHDHSLFPHSHSQKNSGQSSRGHVQDGWHRTLNPSYLTRCHWCGWMGEVGEALLGLWLTVSTGQSLDQVFARTTISATLCFLYEVRMVSARCLHLRD